MKYLLITTRENRNTGDELIRIGVQNLIDEIDDNAEYILLDKEKWEYEPIEFDKCILCGMPLWWSNEVSYSQSIGWWGAIFNGYPTERKKDFLILGAGNVVGKKRLHDPVMYGAAIQEAVDKAFAVTTRNYVYDHPGLIDSICPAAFAVTNPKEPEIKICNFMPEGAHDKHFYPAEADLWKEKTNVLAEFCKENDFYFIEHSRNNEFEDGRSFGWNEDKIIKFDKAEKYLPVYARSSHYFGNRLHGALLVASLGRPAVGVGYESRLGMVEKVGGETAYPSQVSVDTIKRLLDREPGEIPEVVLEEKQKLQNLLTRFLEA